MVVKNDALYYIITIEGNHNNKVSLAHIENSFEFSFHNLSIVPRIKQVHC
jgi:hypothetical protein